MRKRLLACGVLAALILSMRASAANYYVAPNGSDSNPGTQASPFREIRKGVAVAVAGDSILVADGTYKGFTIDERFGQAGQPIAIRALGSNAEVLPTTDRAAWENRDNIIVNNSAYITLDGLRTFNAPRAGIRLEGSPFVTVRNMVSGNNTTWGMLTGHCDDLLIENNECYGSAVEHGIYVSNSGDRPVVRNNRIHGNRANGLHMNADASQGGDGVISGALVENNIIYNNGLGGGSGINCDGVSDSVFRNNLIYNAHHAGICLYMIDAAQPSRNNLVVNNTIDVSSQGKWAMQIHNGSSGNVVFNNIFLTHHASRGSIHLMGPDDRVGLVCDYNILSTNARVATVNDDASYLNLAQWQALGYDTHSVSAAHAAVFVDWATGDFHPKAGSPAVDHGIASLSGKSAPGLDREGAPRPQGLSHDAGAYEFPSNQAPSIDSGPTATPNPVLLGP